MNYKPCGDKILIKLDPIQEKTPGGIVRVQTGFIDFVWATVVEVSDGFWTEMGNFVGVEFKPGDRVMYQSGQAIKLEDMPDHALILQAAIVMREKREGDDLPVKKKGNICTCGDWRDPFDRDSQCPIHGDNGKPIKGADDDIKDLTLEDKEKIVLRSQDKLAVDTSE